MGIIISIFLFMNGVLSKYTGLYLSTFLIHLLGLIPAVILFFIFEKNETKNILPTFKANKLIFLGGTIGVIITLANNFAVYNIGVLLMTLSMTAGQFICSSWIDFTGSFGFKKRKPSTRDYLAIALVFSGVILISI